VILLLNVVAEGIQPRSVGWISLQPDGSISVGLSDRTFVSPAFRARNFVWNLYNRVTLEYLVPHTPDTLEPVVNPHLTFHPPIYFHLRANGEEELFAGIAEPRLMLHDQETVPWLRFVSKPVSDLSAARPPRDPERTAIETVAVPSADGSIGLGIDFVRASHNEEPGFLLSRCFDCGEHRIHVFVEALPPQVPTLAWYHQG
jgi:hypothetical protein